MKILLDNGHGKETAGKRSPVWSDGSQLFEWEFNRDITQGIYHDLVSQGVDVELIVKEETDVPLEERAARVNEIVRKTDAKCLLVSVHANAGRGVGWEIFYCPGSSLSAEVAHIFSLTMDELLPEQKNRGVKKESFYILRHTSCPAVLTENFFMDTERDCRFLMSEEGRRSIIALHVKAILKIMRKW